MLKFALRWHSVIGMVAVIIVAAGCVQLVPDASQATSVSQSQATETPIPSSTPTQTDTPTPTEAPTEELTEEATEELAIQLEVPTETPTTEAFDLPVVENPTETPTSAAVAQVIDDFDLSATVVIREITQTVEVGLTMTAAAAGIGVTNTPTPSPTVDTTGPVVTSPPPVSGANCVHEVRAGENLFRLSLRYGVSIAEIAAASGVTNIQFIRVGQRLTIPGCGTTGVFPPPTSTAPDTGSPTVPGTPGGGGFVHVVEQYETLFQLSLRYNVPVASIAAANGITNINLIIIGDEIFIPQ